MTRHALTTPLARPAAPKAPAFTTDVFSTRSFGPGHLLGAALLGLGLYGTIKYALAQGRARQARSALPSSDRDPQVAQTNVRGQYGRRT